MVVEDYLTKPPSKNNKEKPRSVLRFRNVLGTLRIAVAKIAIKRQALRKQKEPTETSLFLARILPLGFLLAVSTVQTWQPHPHAESSCLGVFREDYNYVQSIL